MASLLILGGGRMGAAIVGGLVRAGWAAREQVVVVERRPEARAAPGERPPQITAGDGLGPPSGPNVAGEPAHPEAPCRAPPPPSAPTAPRPPVGGAPRPPPPPPRSPFPHLYIRRALLRQKKASPAL